MVTTHPPKTIVKPTALGPVVNTDTKLLIYGLFQKGRVLAQDEDQRVIRRQIAQVHWPDDGRRVADRLNADVERGDDGPQLLGQVRSAAKVASAILAVI